jgi:hypothetical protein
VLYGLGVYSAVQVVNNVALQPWLAAHYSVWYGIRVVSFQMALVVWALGLRRALPAAEPAPALLEPGTYEELAPQVSYRLRVLNDRLLAILRG